MLSLNAEGTFSIWNAKGWHDGFDQTQNVESTAAYVGKEKHNANAPTKLWTQGSTDHVWDDWIKESLSIFM